MQKETRRIAIFENVYDRDGKIYDKKQTAVTQTTHWGAIHKKGE